MTVIQNVHINEQLIPILEKVSDPEIPVLSILEMGVVRSAQLDKNHVYVKITPTYSGCQQWMLLGMTSIEH